MRHMLGLAQGMLVLLGVGLGTYTATAGASAQAIDQGRTTATKSEQQRAAPAWEDPVEQPSASGGSMTQNEPYQAPTTGQGMREEAAVPYTGEEATSTNISAIEDVRARNEQVLMAIDGVQGVGTGHGPLGNEAIVVYLRDASVRQRIPTQVGGYPIVAVVTGPIDAYGVPGSPPDQPRNP